ncbi:hypothetical protein HDU76_003578, partial [Blyttiomyces sp. JEL0837]
ASEKVRDFLIKKIDSLRAPNTNITVIQQNVLLKFKELYYFLLERYSDAAFEVRATYMTTVGAYFFASFEKYVKSLQNLQKYSSIDMTLKTVIADKLDLMGSEERGRRGLFMGKTSLKDKTNVYSLGDRIQVLTSSDTGIILAHIAEEQHLKFPYEVIFKSVSRLLMDNSSSEYVFTTEFFLPAHKRSAKSPDFNPGAVFAEMFEPTLKFIQNTFKSYVDNSFDAVGILLCIRLNSFHLRIMQKRRIPCLENFMNYLNILLWPRFQAIIDLHIDSLRKASTAKLRDAHPHFITRRYAEFAVSILTLNEGFDDALLANSLLRLRNEVESLLGRMADEVPDNRGKIVLLINNYDLVLSILAEYNLASFDDEKAYFNAKMEVKKAEFIDEELKPMLSFLIEFVERAELEKNLDNLDTTRFETVASEFNNAWKPIISDVNNSVLQAFPNFQNGARILNAVLTQMLIFYKRFMVLWEKRFTGKGRKVHPVGIQTIMVEIKKLKSNY